MILNISGFMSLQEAGQIGGRVLRIGEELLSVVRMTAPLSNLLCTGKWFNKTLEQDIHYERNLTLFKKLNVLGFKQWLNNIPSEFHKLRNGLKTNLQCLKQLQKILLLETSNEKESNNRHQYILHLHVNDQYKNR